MFIYIYDETPHDYLRKYVVVENRMVSGDLKVTQLPDGSFEVDQSDYWLFDWEKNSPDCFARFMQHKRYISNLRFFDVNEKASLPTEDDYDRE